MRGPPSEGSSKPSLRKAFVSLKNRDFRILFAGMLVSNSAMGMQMLARGYLAYDLTGSFAIMGVISISFAIPMLLFSMIGGATADRMDKRSLMLVTQFGTGGTALATGLMISMGVINVPLLFAVGLVQGTVLAFRMPVQLAMLAEIVPEDELMSAMAINNAAMNATRPLAPAAAGLLLAAWGVEWVYYAQTLMYAITLVFLIQLPRTTSHLQGAENRRGVLAEAASGLGYVAADRGLMMLLFMGIVPMMLMIPPMMTMLPGFAAAELGLEGDGLGFLMAVGGIGGLIGSFVIATLTEFPRKPLLQVFAGFGAGFGLLALGLGSKAFGIPGAIVALVFLSVFQGPYMTLNMTMVMMQTRQEYLGRVMAVFMLLFSVMPFMSLPMGLLADSITASSTFALAGVALLAFMSVVFVANPRYHFRIVHVADRRGDSSLSGAAWSAFSGGGSGGGAGGGPMGAGVPMGAGRGFGAPGAPVPPPAQAGRRDYMGNGSTTAARDYMSAGHPATEGQSNGSGEPEVAETAAVDGVHSGSNGGAPSDDGHAGAAGATVAEAAVLPAELIAERVDLPASPKSAGAGAVERAAIAAVAASVVTGALSRLFLRRPSNDR